MATARADIFAGLERTTLLRGVNEGRGELAIARLGLPRELARKVLAARVAVPGKQFASPLDLARKINDPRLIKWYLGQTLPACSDDRPVLMLPVRLEVGVAAGALRIRFRLDELHVQAGAALPRPGMLPDRFVVYLYDSVGRLAHTPVAGRLIHEETVPPADFDAALANGLAVSIPVSDLAVDATRRLSRIVVAGLARRDPAAARTSVEQLAAVGSERLARALGVTFTPEAAHAVVGPSDAADARAGDMNAALWPATGGYFLRAMLGGRVAQQDLDALGEHARRFVRNGGPLPSLRVGERIYGVLPATRLPRRGKDAPGGWESSRLDLPSNAPVDDALHRALTSLSGRWRGRALDPDLIPRVSAVDDHHQALLGIMSMQPFSSSITARPIVDPRFTAWTGTALRDRLYPPGNGETPAQTVREWVAANDEERGQYPLLLAAVTGSRTPWYSRVPLAKILGWWDVGETPADLIDDLFARSLAIEAASGPARLVGDAIARLSRSPILDFFNEVQTPEEIVKKIEDDPTFGKPSPLAYGVRISLARRMMATRDELPDGRFTSLAEIDAVRMVGADTMHDMVYTFELDSAFDRRTLFHQTLDLYTHRLDAWLTSLASKRLASLRTAQPNGLHIGAYGYLEDVDLTPPAAGLAAPLALQAEPPRCLILAVPAARGARPDTWSEEQLAAIVGDTMDLAKLRTVDLDALAGRSGDAIAPLVPSLLLSASAEPGQPAWARAAVAKSIDEWLAPLLILDRSVDFQGLTRWSLHPRIPDAPDASDPVFTAPDGSQLVVGEYGEYGESGDHGDSQTAGGSRRTSRAVLLGPTGLRVRLPQPCPALRLEMDTAGVAALRAFDAHGAPITVHATIEDSLGSATVFSDAFSVRVVALSQVLVSAPDMASIELGTNAALQALRVYRAPDEQALATAALPAAFYEQFPAWIRLEPHARSADPGDPATAPLADPLWTLARQWQTGELEC